MVATFEGRAEVAALDQRGQGAAVRIIQAEVAGEPVRVARQPDPAFRVAAEARFDLVRSHVQPDALQDQCLDGGDVERFEAVGQSVRLLERQVCRVPLEAGGHLLGHLSAESRGDVGLGEQAQLDEDLAHPLLFMLDDLFRHAVDHADVVCLRERSGAQQHPAQRFAQRTAFGTRRLASQEVDARDHAVGRDFHGAGQLAALDLHHPECEPFEAGLEQGSARVGEVDDLAHQGCQLRFVDRLLEHAARSHLRGKGPLQRFALVDDVDEDDRRRAGDLGQRRARSDDVRVRKRVAEDGQVEGRTSEFLRGVGGSGRSRDRGARLSQGSTDPARVLLHGGDQEHMDGREQGQEGLQDSASHFGRTTPGIHPIRIFS